MTLDEAVDQPFSVEYGTTADTAAEGYDFTPIAGAPLNFSGGQGEVQPLTVSVVDDQTVELDERFFVDLFNLQAGGRNVTVADPRGDGVIEDDDIELAITAAAAVQDEGDAGATTEFTFDVTRSGDLSGSTTVYYTVTGSGGAPADGADFVGGLPTNEVITFAATESSKEIKIEVEGDSDVEPDEGFTVTLHSPSAPATIATGQALGTIENDDLIDLELLKVLGDGFSVQVQFAMNYSSESAAPFDITLYRSADGVTPDGVLSVHTISDPGSLTPGAHTIGFHPTFSDPLDDYFLLAEIDGSGTVAEAAEDNNLVAFSGGAFWTTEEVLHFHGSADSDAVQIVEGASIELHVNGTLLTQLSGDVDAVHIRTHEGNDGVSADGVTTLPVRIFGGAGDDFLTGGDGDDLLQGGAGDDELDGGSGDDTLLGGDGSDEINGGSGNDFLYGEWDVVQPGQTGADFLVGGEGDDYLDGGPGYDSPEIVDDGQAAYTESVGAAWADGPAAGGFNEDYRRHSTGSGANTAIWSFDDLPAGEHYVLATWPADAVHADNAVFSVYDDTLLLGSFAFDQSQSPADVELEDHTWLALGGFAAASGTLRVELSDAGQPGKYVAADAVMVVPVAGTLPPIPVVPLLDLTVTEDSTDPLELEVDLADHYDLSGGVTFVASTDDSSVAAASINGTTLQVTPALDAVGQTTVSVLSTNPQGLYFLVSFELFILSQPDAPVVAEPLPDLSVQEDAGPLSLTLSGVFEDPDGEALIYSVVSDDVGVVSPVVSGADLTLTFPPDAFGTANITVTATGLVDGLSVDDVFTVTVNPVNDAPTAAAPLPTITVDEDTTLNPPSPDPTIVDVSGLFADADDPPGSLILSIHAHQASAFGPSIENVSVAGGLLTFDTVADMFGFNELTLRATDSAGAYVDSPVVVVVEPINDDPVGVEDPPLSADTLSLTGVAQEHVFDLWAAEYFSDVEDDVYLTYSVESVSDLTLFADGKEPRVEPDGFLRMFPKNDAGGVAEVTLRASDGAAYDEVLLLVNVGTDPAPISVVNLGHLGGVDSFAAAEGGRDGYVLLERDGDTSESLKVYFDVSLAAPPNEDPAELEDLVPLGSPTPDLEAVALAQGWGWETAPDGVDRGLCAVCGGRGTAEDRPCRLCRP